MVVSSQRMARKRIGYVCLEEGTSMLLLPAMLLRPSASMRALRGLRAPSLSKIFSKSGKAAGSSAASKLRAFAAQL